MASRPLAERESMRWLDAAEHAKRVLHEAAMVTVLDDRESDIYPKWARVPAPNVHRLSRSMKDRCLVKGGKLYAAMAGFPIRTAQRHAAAARNRSASAHGAGGAALRRGGDQTSEQERAWAGGRGAAAGDRGDGKHPLPASTVFSDEAMETIEALVPELEGNTERQQNPHPRQGLARAGWVIARLGGWNCYYKPPGPITFRRGMEQFYAFHPGRLTQLRMMRDVRIP